MVSACCGLATTWVLVIGSASKLEELVSALSWGRMWERLASARGCNLVAWGRRLVTTCAALAMALVLE